MPHDYFVRITHSYEASVRVLSAWALRCEKMVCYEHVGTQTEKIHIHVVILGSSVCKKQLRNIGQQFVPLKGNENCSFKECQSWETPLVYMTKGNLEPKYLMGFTKEECDSAKAKWVEPSAQPSKQRQIYNECFYIESEGWWKPDMSNHDEVMRADLQHSVKCDCEFNKVKVKAKRFVMSKCDVWDVRAMGMYKMLVNTYCMFQGVPFPDKTKWKEWF